MPCYTFRCECGFEEEVICRIAVRDEVLIECEQCGAVMQRVEVYALQFDANPYTPGAVMWDGSTVNGHFGKEAKKIRPSQRGRKC